MDAAVAKGSGDRRHNKEHHVGSHSRGRRYSRSRGRHSSSSSSSRSRSSSWSYSSSSQSQSPERSRRPDRRRQYKSKSSNSVRERQSHGNGSGDYHDDRRHRGGGRETRRSSGDKSSRGSERRGSKTKRAGSPRHEDRYERGKEQRLARGDEGPQGRRHHESGDSDWSDGGHRHRHDHSHYSSTASGRRARDSHRHSDSDSDRHTMQRGPRHKEQDDGRRFDDDDESRRHRHRHRQQSDHAHNGRSHNDRRNSRPASRDYGLGNGRHDENAMGSRYSRGSRSSRRKEARRSRHPSRSPSQSRTPSPSRERQGTHRAASTTSPNSRDANHDSSGWGTPQHRRQPVRPAPSSSSSATGSGAIRDYGRAASRSPQKEGKRRSNADALSTGSSNNRSSLRVGDLELFKRHKAMMSKKREETRSRGNSPGRGGRGDDKQSSSAVTTASFSKGNVVAGGARSRDDSSSSKSSTAGVCQQRDGEISSNSHGNVQTAAPPSLQWLGGAVSDFTELVQIGEGSYGEVFRAVHTATDSRVALKKIKSDTDIQGFPITALREIKILRLLSHDCIVSLRGVVSDVGDAHHHLNLKMQPAAFYMVFEYMEHDLTGLLDAAEQKLVVLTDQHLRQFSRHLIMGLHYCHGEGILHRDLKSSNLLVSNKGFLKIADWGLSRHFDASQERQYTNKVITRYYRPPELLLGSHVYGPEVDVWSAGCIIGEMYTRRPLFPGDSDMTQLAAIMQVCGTLTPREWPGLTAMPDYDVLQFNHKHPKILSRRLADHRMSKSGQELMGKLLCYDPKRRLTTDRALQHPFLTCDFPTQPLQFEKEQDCHELWSRNERHKRREARRKHGHQQGQGQAQQQDPAAQGSANNQPPADRRL